ncbi:putative spermidine/putrescine transport system substrate-binding protein [Mycobacterium frederiksbergense]|uniref:Spermidine/putrescine transport system substrate-binding protein n=1 Tax=Mycolicibacterium frederiksbergense TaxID=117567 RepID=A0ABT6L8M0_9MYCO|nr:extracellular solute-binding protein [Mycolicibacterium frederiksbergense]MDH6199298.1 putative spermidine/putrescine transport system substrate-binding protein [Mycolicibacterium frederiksbergense]
MSPKLSTGSGRTISRISAAALGVAVLLSACSAPNSSDGTGSSARQLGSSLDEITQRAKEEGKVHLLAYPNDWANYAESFDLFTKKYGVKVEVSNPEFSSSQELEAVRNLKGQPTQPDVLDIGATFTQPAIDDKLVAPYKPSTFAEIPEQLKDPNGNWVAAYYGVMSIAADANKVDVPKTWADLKDPKYKGKIAMGDPRDGAMQLAAVFAASLANGGSLDNITPGIDFFADLAKDGYLVPAESGSQALATGQAAVMVDWNFNLPGVKDEMEKSGVNLQIATPSDGVFGTYYAQPLTVSSPQPNAGALWIDWLLSDDGAISYAKSGAIPARYQTLAKNGAIPADVLQNLPPKEVIEKITFPSPANNEAATAKITADWGPRVASKMGF